MPEPREVAEGRQYQGEDESIAYKLTTTPWGTAPSSVVVVVKDVNNAYLDVTSTVMPTGSPSVVGDVITLPALKLLTRDHTYRVEIKFTAQGNNFEPYIMVSGQR